MVRKNPSDIPQDFDDLLNASVTPGIDLPTDDGPEEPAEPIEIDEPDEGRGYDSENEEPAELSPAARRIQELEAELAKPVQAQIKDMAKTPEELRIEELESKLAERNAAIIDVAPARLLRADTTREDAYLIHFIEDGFSDLGGVWLRGQEVWIDDTIRATTLDRNGNTWLDDLSIEAQYRRWGRQYIAYGKFIPRPGEVFTDAVAREDVRRQGAISVLVTAD